jgi:hypothetical protein
LARYIGEKTETTIRRNQYVRVRNEKYQLPDLDVLASLKPNNYKVTAYYLPETDGTIPQVHLYQDLEFIGTCKKLIVYNKNSSF